MKQSYRAAFWIVLLFSISLIFFAPLHTQDGPNHRKTTLILSRLAQSPVEAQVFQNGFGIFNTNTLFQGLYLPFKNLLSIDAYEKLYVAFFLASLLLLYRLFLKTWSPKNADLWPLLLPFLFHPLYLRGLYNYLASVAITLLALICIHRGMEKKTGRYVLAFFLLCWIGQLAHPFTFIILSLVLMIQGFLVWRNDWKHFFPFVLITLSFLALGFVLPLFQSGIGMSTAYGFKGIIPLIAGLFVFNFMDYALWVLLIPVPFSITWVFLAGKNLYTQPFKKNALWLSVLLAYFIFPSEGGGSAHANERFLPFVFLFFPLALDDLGELWRKRIVTLAFLTFFTFSGGFVWGMFRLDQEVKNARSVLSHLPKISRLYPINFDLKGPSLINGDLYHVWANYENDRIVFSPYLFALPKLTPLLKALPNQTTYFPATPENYPRRIFVDQCVKEWLYDSTHCERWKEQGMLDIFQDAQYYDYWLVHSPPPDFLERLQKIPHLQLVVESGKYSLWRYAQALSFDPSISY